MGIVDANKQKDLKYSSHSGHAVCYDAYKNGFMHYGDIDGNYLTE